MAKCISEIHHNRTSQAAFPLKKILFRAWKNINKNWDDLYKLSILMDSWIDASVFFDSNVVMRAIEDVMPPVSTLYFSLV